MVRQGRGHRLAVHARCDEGSGQVHDLGGGQPAVELGHVGAHRDLAAPMSMLIVPRSDRPTADSS
jgi:hypothetical protein